MTAFDVTGRKIEIDDKVCFITGYKRNEYQIMTKTISIYTVKEILPFDSKKPKITLVREENGKEEIIRTVLPLIKVG